jgi:Skp family chaperone for outer membrane proteins
VHVHECFGSIPFGLVVVLHIATVRSQMIIFSSSHDYQQGLSKGVPKIVPSLLVQHHGNPPPEPEEMAAWMNSLRKRHAKQYEKLQKQVHDLQIYNEIKEGVKDSIKSDKKREKEEAEAEAARKAKEEAEAARQAAIEERRKTLLDELPEEKKGSDVKRIALRFPDGRKGERGFDPGQPVSVLFNWVDAIFEIERENVVLTTMNGKMTFSWEEEGSSDTSLEDAGLGKSTAFRVTEKVVEDDSDGTSKLTL